MSYRHSNRMLMHCALLSVLLMILVILAACSTGSDTVTSANGSGATDQGASGNQGISTKSAGSAKSTVVVPSSVNGKAGNAPLVILSPTVVAGNNQQVTLADRTLLIGTVSKQSGTNAGMTAISFTVTIKNTGAASIQNQSTYFQLLGAEGDTFGLSTTTAASFFGGIDANAQRSGTLVFQVPSSAATKLRLLYRSEVATETTLIPLNI